ncbi:MAG: ABC transporter ATP-binding protein [Caldiserica bacterium]|jgi:peptide/nickel transport system ATP-binding protein|nr:ABC transporter ATP-binding protein [Caldisericota bacterium]
MEGPVLWIKDLKVWYRIYGGFLKVIDGIEMKVLLGERVGLVGETGCGKTTTMKAALHLLPPNGKVPNGQIFLDGKDISRISKSELRKIRNSGIAMIFQDPTSALNPVFTVGEQLIEAIANGKEGKSSRQENLKDAVSILEKVLMPDPQRIMRNFPFQLSGGMRQRVCIAMALSRAKKLLIADEPTTSLDVTIQAQILDLIQKIVVENNLSLILITHSLGIARQMTDRIYVMYAGTIVETAPTSVFYEEPLHPYTKGLFDSVPRLTGEGFADGIPGRIPNYLNPPLGCRFQPRCGKSLPICSQKRPPLLEISKDHWVSCFLYEGKGGGK